MIIYLNIHNMDQNLPKMWANFPVYGDIFIAPECGTNRTFTAYAPKSQKVLTRIVLYGICGAKWSIMEQIGEGCPITHIISIYLNSNN